MLITESQMNIGRSSAISLLDRMSYLTEAESVYAPAMVPVVESTSQNAHLIRLEDMISFAESNGIEDLGYALQLVCEASQIEPSTVAFTVQAESVIADPSVAELVGGIMQEGVSISAIHANPNSAACQAVDIAMNYYLESGSDALLEAFANDDWNTYFDIIGEETANDEKTAHQLSREQRDATAKDAQEGRAKARESMEGAISKIWDKVKSGANIARDWLAKALDRLNTWAREVQDKIASVNEKDRGIWQKIKGKIATVIQAVTRKLHNVVQANRGEIAERENPLAPAKK